MYTQVLVTAVHLINGAWLHVAIQVCMVMDVGVCSARVLVCMRACETLRAFKIKKEMQCALFSH